MTRAVQLAGIVAYMLLAAAILFLIGHTFDAAMAKATPDGKVPLADAGLFTALLLSFREVIGRIGSIFDHQDRADLTQALSNSTPTQRPNPPAAATDEARA